MTQGFGKKDNNHLSEFGRLLGRCFLRENNLSDVTWAVLNVIPEFRKEFANYFLPDSCKVENPEEVVVECESSLEKKAGGSGRVDFRFNGPGWSLLLENKLDDIDYHLDYQQKDPDIYYGLIANHQPKQYPQSRKWTVHTWDEFVENFYEKHYGAYEDLFRIFIEFVREVCVLEKIHKFEIKPKELFSLYNFSKTIKQVISSTRSEKYQCEIDNRNKSNFDAGWSGYYFNLNTQKGKKLLCYFGIFYWEKDNVCICVTVEPNKNNNRLFTRIQKNISKTNDFELSNEDYEISICCKKETIIQLNKKEANEQKELLRDFFKTACDTFVASLEKK